MRSNRPDPENDWRLSPLSLVIAGLIRALVSTVRFHFHGDEQIRAWEAAGRHFILTFWHRHMVVMRYAYQGRRMTVLISQSWDGELAARTLERLGVDSVRGSSSQGGGMALRSLLRIARSGSDLTFTPDGPRGPLRVVQPGVVLASALSGLPIMPVALAASRAKLLRSWDRMLVPLPGSDVEVVYGEPIFCPARGPLDESSDRLTRALNDAEARAESLAGGRA